MMTLEQQIAQSHAATVTDEIKRLAIACLDYTTLNETDTEDDVRTLCQQSITTLGRVAAVCIYPDFVEFAKCELIDTHIAIATVVNFPSGNEALDRVLAVTKSAVFDGADEIDVVLPYTAYLAGQQVECSKFLAAVKKSCGNKILKVILETGELNDPQIIRQASETAINAGADFLKTSTGKVKVGATLEAAAVMLQTMHDHFTATGKTVGFKASGGIRTAQDVAQYITLARAIMGPTWVTPKTFRLGASSLLANLLGDTPQVSQY